VHLASGDCLQGAWVAGTLAFYRRESATPGVTVTGDMVVMTTANNFAIQSTGVRQPAGNARIY